MIELGNHLAKRRVQGRKRLFLVALCSAPSGIAGYYRPDAGTVILTFLGVAVTRDGVCRRTKYSHFHFMTGMLFAARH